MTLFRSFTFALVLLLAACSSGGPSAGDLKRQLTQHFDSMKWGDASCSSHFTVVGVRVNDKRVDGGHAVANVTVSVKAKRAMTWQDGVSMCYGAQAWQEGEVKEFPMTVTLERWSSGWRITSL